MISWRKPHNQKIGNESYEKGGVGQAARSFYFGVPFNAAGGLNKWR